MSIRDLVPRQWTKKKLPIQKDVGDPFALLHREMNRLFEDFSHNFFEMTPFSSEAFEKSPWGAFHPNVDVSETDKEIRVTAELPGMTEKDVQVSLANDTLTIRGEKKVEHEEKKGNYYRSERSFGSFHRSVPMPEGVDGSKSEATFKNGLLTVVVPKKKETSGPQPKKIEVKKE